MAFDSTLHAEGDLTFASGIEGARKLLDLPSPPDAVVAANDDMAAAVLWIAHQRGLHLPVELAVTGFDDTLLATWVWPPLTTVRQAIKCLRQSIREPADKTDAREIILPLELI